MSRQYDYIIAGMGCAGLSLAMQLKTSAIPFKKVLLIDKDLKNQNDRTWCFWTKTKDAWYEPIIKRQWEQLLFVADEAQTLHISPYRYCLIEGLDFYAYCLKSLATDQRFDIIQGEISTMSGEGNKATLQSGQESYEAKLIFNSALRQHHYQKGHNNLVQHFKGWKVTFDEAVVDAGCPVFMDFSIDQQNDCRFVYTIPFSAHSALVEYTGFSAEGIGDKEYDEALAVYMSKKYPGAAYRVTSTEKGQIPMYESEFINPFGERVINIGTAGNASKASSGYTFYFIQQMVGEVTAQLMKDANKVRLEKKPWRFRFYDKVLLDVISKKTAEPKYIFARLFKRNQSVAVFDFLNEESNWRQEIKILNSLPKIPFLKSGLRKVRG